MKRKVTHRKFRVASLPRSLYSAWPRGRTLTAMNWYVDFKVANFLTVSEGRRMATIDALACGAGAELSARSVFRAVSHS
jgi:hypothetical protein